MLLLLAQEGSDVKMNGLRKTSEAILFCLFSTPEHTRATTYFLMIRSLLRCLPSTISRR